MRTEITKFWTASDLGLDLLSAHFYTHSFPRHTHDYFVIGLNEVGVHSNFLRGAGCHVGPGTIIVLHPGDVHTGETAPHKGEGWIYRSVYPSIQMMQSIAEEVTGLNAGMPYFPELVINDPEVFRQLLDAHRTLETSTDSLERQSIWKLAIAALVRKHARPRSHRDFEGTEHRAVKLAREFIDANCTEDLSLRQVARVACLSEFHLIRVFQKHMGVPPHKYLTQVRIERAKQMLASGQPIAEVALATGFSDQSHFTRRFKSLTGATPGRYQH
jgi:AraC-like DNA-binding protein